VVFVVVVRAYSNASPSRKPSSVRARITRRRDDE
jgi:hypothetical protein